ncbi:MAG: succinyl-diaminopimelate desuccinylase [Candidatus Nanopelagicales bacterium]|jgi:succinyl-diaminopimelate desuccinylase|nr:succinyl-diaminopimelate desuccinylase [Candidatus Nanopelagicales bacterium]
MALDPAGDIITLLGDLVDIPSESRDEGAIADAIEAALAGAAHLSVERDGNTIVARTNVGHPDRVLICGHIDTVPEADNLPHHIETVADEERLVGLGSCDMKGGVAVALALAVAVAEPTRDITYVFYEAEEIEERYNGLKRLAATRPDLLAGDFAVLMEPSDAGVEAGCQGTLRAEIHLSGRRSHSARSWLGRNAIHAAADVLARLAEYQPSRVVIDGLEYREGLNAVGISGGVAGNVIPDECVVVVNYRFAPSLTPELAVRHVQTVFEGLDVRVVDVAAGAMPGLSQPAAQAFLEVTGATPRPKFGWTDVARFSDLGIPAVNFGPGDPALAHTREEYVATRQVRSTFEVMRAWLTAPVPVADPWTSTAGAPGSGRRRQPGAAPARGVWST